MTVFFRMLLLPNRSPTAPNRSPTNRNKLFCTLTIQLLDQSLESIKTHMRGQKFRRARGEHHCTSQRVGQHDSTQDTLDSCVVLSVVG